MPVLILHLFAGMLAGSMFGAQTLVTLVLFAFIEVAACGAMHGVAVGLGWLLVSQLALQTGYLAGIFLRSGLERAGIVVAAHGVRHSQTRT
jgi:hypothetical protein